MLEPTGRICIQWDSADTTLEEYRSGYWRRYRTVETSDMGAWFKLMAVSWSNISATMRILAARLNFFVFRSSTRLVDRET